MATDDDLMAWAPKPTAPTGIALAGYSDFRLVAQGGEGTVYRARQDGLGRDVAVKVLEARDDATLARFRRELEITVRLGRQHPHIVTVLDTGVVRGRPCIVMEFHDLGSLHDRLRARGPLPVAEVVAAGVAVADALAFAHGQGVLHRDVKPQNVLVLPTSYVLADFGIARAVDAGHSASLHLVSYRHAAPQMIDGEKPAATDDVWSLGSTLFTLLDGAPPFASDDAGAESMLGYLGRVRSAAPRALTRPDVPPALAAIIERCLARAREDRFPDAASLRAALAAVDTAWAPTPSTVDPDSTRAVAPLAPPQVFPEGPTSLPDFGPRPAAEAPAPEPAAPEEPRTWADQLADLTVRHHPVEPEVPDFGPRPTTSGGAPLPTPPADRTTWAQPSPTTDTDTATTDTDTPAPPADRTTRVAQPSSRTDFDFDEPAPVPTVPNRDVPPVQVAVLPGEPNTASTFLAPLDEREPEAPRRHRLRWLVPLAAVVVVGGAVLGVVLTGGPSGRQTAAPTSSEPPTSSTTSEPPVTASVPPGGDPRFAPALDRVEVLGPTSVELDWTDPSDGRAQFVLVDVTGAKPQPLVTVAAGLTTHVVEGLDTTRRHCFQVLAIGLDDPGSQRGASARTCTPSG
ncbi:serine/threonine-protein kinase [Umezawaea sp.]|uniref:serine/threonine-protein kinase n=1 Tax=Umezawaea sp. TaxID=1955258 RepID=UPI002ECFD0CB